jgi:hypothetical protein
MLISFCCFFGLGGKGREGRAISTDDRHMFVPSQFGGLLDRRQPPVTVFALLAWLLWLQRAEMLKHVEEMVAKYRKMRPERAGDKV